ncbi:hypothetical protein [Glutamicibacter uratoxydans]|uniref:hypothetical protein n=1 Tax=Glutamicibacter uratoxydans TaxID=43667 RepID=UPI003D7011D7
MVTSFGQSAPVRYEEATKLPLAKLQEARKTLREFFDAWDGYCRRAEVGFEPSMSEMGVLTWVARIRPSVRDTDMERKLRYVVNDVRTALDNLVHEIGMHVGADEKVLFNNAFPVVAETDSWRKAVKDRLSQLPQPVVDRIRDVQPFARPRRGPFPKHPLALLSDLDNANKHRDSFQVGLVPNPGQIRQLSSISFQLPVELAATITAMQHSEEQVDEMIKFLPGLGPVHDGDPVFEIRLPNGISPPTLEISPLDLPLSLAAVYDQERSGHFPIRPVIIDAYEYVRDTVLYVAGLDTKPPRPAELAQEAINWPR